jgi:hypothetical protein
MSSEKTTEYNAEMSRDYMFLRMDVLLREALTKLVYIHNSGSHNLSTGALYKLIQEIEQCLNEKAVLERDEVIGIPV